MNLDQPLSEAELDELDQFLTAETMPKESMDIAMLDGFLTALIVGPNTPIPKQWLPEVWGENEASPMQFENETQAERMLSLVMRMFNDRILSLQGDIDEFEPLIFEHEVDGELTPIIDEWCMGFVRGMHLDPEGWKPLLAADDEASASLLTPMLLYGTEEGWEELDHNPALKDRHLDLAASIGPCVLGIRDYWLPARKAASTFRREGDKVGRNDLCPCGSGKKYKACCGSPGNLH